MLSHIRKNWSLYAAVAFFIVGVFFLFSGHAKAQQVVPEAAVAVDTGGYGIIGIDAKDAATCADKDACVLLTEKAAMHISHQLAKAQEQAAKYKAQLEAIKEAKAASKCI
jgi:hypothetical protein